MHEARNGMPAADLNDVTWRKSRHSNSQGTCVELASLPDGAIALRNSRHPDSPALVYTRAEIDAFLRGAKDGEFDDLLS
jgi:diadenosine tetraphosphatase ApaH/serine/threonine PP2A family protein phosphatase